MRIFILHIILLSQFNLKALDKLTLDTAHSHKHSPHKASIYSAILPGLGQAYNRKYWKIPVVAGLLGGSGYGIYHFSNETRFRTNVLSAINRQQAIPNDTRINNKTYEMIKADRDAMRTYRDYFIIGTSVLYILNIVDASIDAHFYKFNIDQPLSSASNKYKIGLHGNYGMGICLKW